MRREYTHELYNRIQSGCDEDNQGWLADFWDNLCAKWNMFWEGVFSGVNRKNFVEINESAESILRDVLEYYGYTEAKLKEIFDLEKQASSMYCDGFMSKADNFVIVDTYLDCMIQAISPKGYGFTADGIKRAFSYDNEYFYPDKIETHIEIAATTRYEYTDTDVKYFTQNEKNLNYFLSTADVTVSYFNNMDAIDTILISVFNMFGIAETEIAKIIDTATDQEKIGYLEETLTGSAYEVAVMKENLSKTIQEMCANSTFSESDVEELTSFAQKAAGLMEKYGENWAEFIDMDKRTKKFKSFENFYKKFGTAEKFLKYVNQYGDAVWSLFVSYDQNLEIIDSIANNATFSSESFEQAVAELTNEYESNFAMFLNETKMATIDNMIKVGKKTVLTAVGVEPLFETTEKIIEFAGKITGMTEKTQGQIKAMTIFNYIGDLESSYEVAFKDVAGMEIDSEDYATGRKNLENTFNLLKNSYEELFTAMSESEDGLKKNYYSYCAKKVGTATMKDKNQFEFLSYDEYIAKYNS